MMKQQFSKLSRTENPLNQIYKVIFECINYSRQTKGTNEFINFLNVINHSENCILNNNIVPRKNC